MRRRSLVRRASQTHQASGNERWLVSYADYMTLAFALFVVLYAMHASKVELQQPMLDGIEQAFVRLSGEAKPAHAANSMVAEENEQVTEGTGSPLSETHPSLAKLKAELELQLVPLLQQDLMELEQEGEWLTLRFDGKLLFANGSALLSQNADIILTAALPPLAKTAHFIRVRGYADNLPVSNELYASNWQLSAERARAVLEWLLTHGVAAPRLALEAFGEFHPQDTQLGERSRANNRRVEIAISTDEWVAPTALPSRALATPKSPELRVYELPNGGIRIGTTSTQDGMKQ